MIAFNGTELSLIQIGVWLAIALLCGVAAQALLGYSHIGLLSAAALGLIGALLGTWLASVLGLPNILTIRIFGVQAELIWCTVGAILLIVVRQAFYPRRGSSYRRRR